MKLESKFKKQLMEEIEVMFPSCIILHNDTSTFQGFPDLLILYRNQWALLECKRSKNARVRPNQIYWVNCTKDMSFSSFIYPENKREVLNELQQSFRSHR